MTKKKTAKPVVKKNAAIVKSIATPVVGSLDKNPDSDGLQSPAATLHEDDAAPTEGSLLYLIQQAGLGSPETTKFVTYLMTSATDRSQYIKDLTKLATSNPEQFKATLAAAVPPADAIYSRDLPCPAAFRQHSHAFLEGITVNRAAYDKDDMFWWQHITDVSLIAAVEQIKAWTESFNPVTSLCGFGYKTISR